MRSASLLLLAFAAGSLVTAVPSIARAAPGAPTVASSSRKATAKEEAEARAAVKRGLVLAARGSAAEALVQYERAKELVPDANLPYRYAAQVLLELGRTEDAIANLEQYLAVDPQVRDADAVRARIAELRAKLPGKLSIMTTPEGAVVVVDGAAEHPHTTPVTDLALSPGDHTIGVRHPGFEPAERRVVVAGGRSAEIAIELVRSVGPAPAIVAPPPVAASAGPPGVRDRNEPAAPSPTKSVRLAIGITVASIGAGLLVTSFVLDRVVASTRDEFDEARASGGDALSIKDRADTQRTWTLVTLVAGGAILVAGVTIALWPSSRSSVAIGPSQAVWQTRF